MIQKICLNLSTLSRVSKSAPSPLLWPNRKPWIMYSNTRAWTVSGKSNKIYFQWWKVKHTQKQNKNTCSVEWEVVDPCANGEGWVSVLTLHVWAKVSCWALNLLIWHINYLALFKGITWIILCTFHHTLFDFNLQPFHDQFLPWTEIIFKSWLPCDRHTFSPFIYN